MSQTEPLISCTNCGRPTREDDAQDLGWSFHSDGAGAPLFFCGLCVHRGHPANASKDTARTHLDPVED